jgi:chaperonin GroES
VALDAKRHHPSTNRLHAAGTNLGAGDGGRPPDFSRRSSMNVRPLADRILVRRIEEQETVRGGIIIPDTAKEKPQEGEVVAVGPGRKTEEGKLIPLDVKKGDRVLIGKYSGTDVKIDGTEYVILREDEVLGVLSKSAK